MSAKSWHVDAVPATARELLKCLASQEALGGFYLGAAQRWHCISVTAFREISTFSETHSMKRTYWPDSRQRCRFW